MKEIEFSRTLDRYISIDILQDYELTSCIAYEMAIRNRELLRLMYDLLMTSDDSYRASLQQELERDFYFNEECIVYFITSFKYHAQFMQIFTPDLDISKIRNKKIILNTRSNINNDDNAIFVEYTRTKKTKINLDDLTDGFKIRLSQEKNKLGEYILYNFSRPILTNSQEQHLYLQFNPALPKSEIKAYLNHVLNTLEKLSHNDAVYIQEDDETSFHLNCLIEKQAEQVEELNNEKFYKQRVSQLATDKETKKFTIPKISLQNKRADQFLIYDYISANQLSIDSFLEKDKHDNIRVMLTSYLQKRFLSENMEKNFNKLNTKEKRENILYYIESTIDAKTIEKYYAQYQDYIENKKYITLLERGIKT